MTPNALFLAFSQFTHVPPWSPPPSDIKVSKAGHAEFVTRPFHRVDDLPNHIYLKLHHERQAEFAENSKIQEKLSNTSFTRRELFICDAEDAQRELVTTNQIRSHCKIDYYRKSGEMYGKFWF